MTRLALALAALLLGAAGAQQQLVVNGQPVPGLSTAVVRGVSYAPAQALADSLGASYVYDSSAQSALFEIGARLLALRVYTSAAEAAADGSALSLDGRSLASEGGVRLGSEVLVPVKPIVTALGGAISYLESRQTVMVVFPRARLASAAVEQGGSRIVLEIDGLTSPSSFFNRALNTLQVRFDRTDALAGQSLSGRGFSRASLTPTAGYLELRLTLEAGYTFESYTAPRPGGFSWVLDIVPESERRAAAAVTRVVLDPGHGAGDPGLTAAGGSEAELSLAFAKRLAAALTDLGFGAELTRQDAEDVPVELRRDRGLGAGLFLSLHAAAVPRGQYNLYYLGDLGSSGSLTLALRENAEGALTEATDATDALRRRILLGLVPDLALGERYAKTLGSELSQRAGLRSQALMAAPLAVLEGAAGRGLLLELSPEDLASETLPEAVAQAVAAMLEREAGD